MFSDLFLKSFRILLLPFSIIIWVVILIRNWLYDKKIMRSSEFGLPLICVGNLAVGGTGKSPMVEYLLAHNKDQFRLATLSRGYKRKTKGYALANEKSTAIDIGDEPMAFHKKFPGVPVAVGEERLFAIPQLLHDRPDIEAIILDDAFQHRAIRAGLNILLTDFSNLYTRDFFLPTGDLRDLRRSAKRAEVIVVTKCPPELSEKEKESITKELRPLSHQKIFFTSISYGSPYHVTKNNFTYITAQTEVLLVTGIANPQPLKKYLEERIFSYHMMHFSDHHIFSIDDWKEIKARFEKLQSAEKIILTTEKDAMRLLKFEHELAGLPFYVMPIEHRFLFGEGTEFDSIVAKFIKEFKQQQQHGQEKQ
jgi:tetraacyldisaccharide 4'-kinase